MADRFLLKQFAGQADNNGVFGSAQQGQGQIVSDIKQVQSLNAFENGWNSATITGDKLPCLEEFQGVQALLCKAIKENYSEGVPLWLSTETYYMDSFVVYNHKLFKNITGSYTTNNPELDTTNWEEYSAGKGDNKTSVINTDKEIEVIGSYNKNTAVGATEIKYDWIGTKQEWLDQQIATLHPEWIWYITDDDDVEKGILRYVGQFIQMICSPGYVPEGTLPVDGAEYTKNQFSDLWTNYLINGKLNTCSYSDYANDMSTYGQCAKFAIDTLNEKFKVPFIKDGAYITQAQSSTELGKSYKQSLPNIKGTWYDDKSGSGSTAETSGCVTVEIYGTRNSAGTQANGAKFSINASLSSSAYQDNAPVQGENVRLRFFVVVSDGSLNQSQMDWANWASSLLGKSNIDMDNLSVTGKHNTNILSFPSNRYKDLTPLASANTYTAPANGWFSAYNANGANGYCLLSNITKKLGNCGSAYAGISDGLVGISVSKGDVVRLSYSGTFNSSGTGWFRFIYAEGEI